jgi:hypothetical protein
MELKETGNKKQASFVIEYADNTLRQKNCLVDVKTGEITIGDDRVPGKKYASEAVKEVRVEFKGKAFSVTKEVNESKATSFKLSNPSIFEIKSKEPTNERNVYANIKNPAKPSADWRN